MTYTQRKARKRAWQAIAMTAGLIIVVIGGALASYQSYSHWSQEHVAMIDQGE